MDELIQEAGIIGIFALLVIREILARTKSSNGRTVEKMRHDALCELLNRVSVNITTQCELLREVKRDVEIVKGKVR